MHKKYIILICALCCASMAWGQTLNQAKKLFENGEFEKAKPAFERMVKQSPSNATYNYWYGACCYETGEKAKAQPYLEKSAARRVIGAYRYLGKLYYDLYRFDEAVENYEQHIEWLEKKERPTEQAEAELEQVKMAARMIKGVEKVAVIDSFVVDKDRFLSAYKISKESGIIGESEEAAGTVYQTEMGNKVIFADNKEDSVMQLYSSIRLLDSWSDPEPITSINEQGNVNYPFLMSDGVTLYYASDGEGSLGGYDIFVTRYDTEDNEFLRPDNIGMPFNSPANDYMYAIDEYSGIGWFASDRRQPEGKVCVYVFVPNETKEVYNYENTDPQLIIDVASLRTISATCGDEEKVKQGRQNLAEVMYARSEKQTKGDFILIIDDTAEYHNWTDFRSAEARKLFQQREQKQKSYDRLRRELDNKRSQYERSNKSGRAALTTTILELEEQTAQLLQEMDELDKQVRNEEIQKLKR